MKKTYIPSTPRSRKLKSVGGGTINVSGGSAQNVPVIEGHTHDNKIILDAITQLHLRILSSLNVDEDGALIVELSNIIKELDATVPTDENLFSALRTVLEIRARSISKTDPDTAQEIITFLKGIIASGTSKFDNIEVGNYTTGPLGAGAAIKMENGVSRMEVDQLDVRMRATFRELIIESLKHIGGQLILSPARMKCTSVVDGGTYYRCYFDTGDGKVSNEFVAGDQARCQVFTGSGVKMYWRLVTSVGTDWINLSKTDAISGSSIPEAGDDIVQLGHRTDTTRQNAQILSTVGPDAPSWKQYKGINAFSLEGKDTTVFSGTGNKIDGKTVFMSSGANVEDGINSKNSNYSSQPTSYKANDTWTLSADTTVNGIAYKSGEILTATQDSTTFVQAHWVKKVRYTDDTAVNNIRGGVNLLLQSDSYDKTSIASNNNSQYPISKTNTDEGSRKFVRIKRTNTTLNPTIISLYNAIPLTALSQSVVGKEITISFDARVNLATTSTLMAMEHTPAKSLSDNGKTINLTTEWTRYYTTFVVSSDLTGGFRFCPYIIQIAGDINDFYLDISRFAVKFGNIKDEWDIAPEDTDAKIADTKLYVEYSTDGTSWHTTFQANDVYMRQKTGVNGTWTGAIKIVGKDGTSVSIKGKVSTSASLPSSASLGDGYIAEDTGHLWVWTGSWTDAGQIQGDNGANSYIHIAYADDSLGGGFSHDPAGKSWIGIYADFTAIDSDNPGDYTWMYAKGDTGESAPLLYLSASAQVVKCNPDNTPQAGQTISIEAKLQNVSGTATFVATPYNDAGTAQTVITLGGTGNTRTLTNAQWLTAYKRIEIVATLGSLTDKVTIYRVADGATGNAGQNAIVGLLTNESVTLQANSAGVVSSFAPANGEFYVYNGTTKVTSGITFSKVSETGCTAAITSAGAYSVSAMSADNATVVLRAVYSGVTIDKVLTISKSRAGADGISITGVDVEFAKNTTPATAPTTGWTTTAPAITGTEQLWTRTKTTYSSGNPTYSTPANITPKTGATGTGIDSVTEEYAISTSKTTQPTTGWSTTQPAWIQGQYIWSRVKVVYKNPASTIYTGYAVSSEWEAVNNLEIGGRNLLRGSSGNFSSSWKYIESGKLKDFDTITVQIWCEGSGQVTIFKDNGYSSVGVIYTVDGYGLLTGIVKPQTNNAANDGSVLLVITGTNAKVMVEKGNKPTNWTPAPEDVQAAIDAEKNRINDILSDNVADPSEKQYLSNLWQEIYAEYPRIWAQANTYAVDKSNYEAKYSALNTLLSPVLANLTVNSTVSGASIRTAFSQYYDARIFLQNAITNKVNQNAGDAAAVAADAQAKANTAKAVTDKFGTTQDGGLISTVMILLRELNSIIETAGISGIQDDGYLPAYWSGGTYAEALAFSELMRAVDRGDNPIASATLNAKMSSIVMLHNGHAKVGELIVKSNGQIIVLDKATGKIKFIINSQNIPTVAELMGGTAFGETKTNSSVSGITGIITLQNTISVDKNNSTLSFAADISLTLRNYTKIADASMSVDLFKNGVLYLNLGSLSVVKLDEGTPPVIDSYSISKIISGIPIGTYSVKITVVASGDVRDYAGSISTSTLAWNFTQSGVRYFQLGLDGLMAFYSDNHFHYTETGGLDVRGATNMPGVLFGATIGSNGAMGSWWGAKKHALKTSEKVSGLTGTYDIFHSIGHSNYQITGNAYGNRTLSIISKSNDSCRVAIYNGTTLIDNQFDIVFIGNNY